MKNVNKPIDVDSAIQEAAKKQKEEVRILTVGVSITLLVFKSRLRSRRRR
jgi:hypothetical protein